MCRVVEPQQVVRCKIKRDDGVTDDHRLACLIGKAIPGVPARGQFSAQLGNGASEQSTDDDGRTLMT